MREIRLIENGKQIGVIYKDYRDNLVLGKDILNKCFDYVANDFSRSKTETERYLNEIKELVPLLHAEILGDGKFWITLFNSAIFYDAVGKVVYYDNDSVEISFE